MSSETAQVGIGTAPGFGLCCFICMVAVVSSVDIAAIIIAKQNHVECNSLGNPINIDLFALIGGSVGLSLSGILVCLSNQYYTTTDGGVGIKKKSSSLYVNLSYLTLLFNLVYGIIGCIVYDGVTRECKVSPLGQVMDICFYKESF